MSGSAGLWAFRLAYELSPIFLTGGIAQNMPGGAFPITGILQAGAFISGGIIAAASGVDPDAFFAHFKPLPGATLIDNQIGNFPFANQAVAANAIIAQPLTLSMLMQCPSNEDNPFTTKLITIMALQSVLQQHSALGGTYTVVTPSYFYTNMILLRLADVSDQESVQPQNAWQWDFIAPLLTLQQAQQAQNSLMSRLTNGTQVTGSSWSGLQPTVGNANSLATPGVVPSSTGVPSAVTPGQSLPAAPAQILSA